MKYSKDSMPLQTEASVERRLREKIRKAGGLCIKLVPVSGKGLPDRLVLLPGGKSMFVELKRPGGRLSVHQIYWHKILRERGFEVKTLFSSQEVDELLI